MKKRCIFFFTLLCLTAVFAACGRKEESKEAEEPRRAYVAEYLSAEEDIPYDQVWLFGNSLYYFENYEEEAASWTLNRYSLTERTKSKLVLHRQGGEDAGAEREIRALTVADDGSIYLIWHQGLAGAAGTEEKLFFGKFDQEGNAVFEQELDLTRDSCFLQTDTAGNVYRAFGNTVVCCDGEGNQKGILSVGNENACIFGLGFSREGKLYAAYNEKEGGFVIIGGTPYQLAELDFEAGKAIDTEKEISGYEAEGIFPGQNEDFLLYDGNGIYDYRIEEQAAGEILKWLDCDINGSYARFLGTAADGTLVAVCREEMTREAEIVLLAQKEITSDMERQTLVLGTLSGNDSTLRSLVVAFNKKSDKYRIDIQAYSADGENYSDALTNFQNAILSGNCPDLIDLSGLDVKNLASQGIFADLMPYLEKSSVLKREDFLENILEEYTIDGKLSAIPYRFSVSSVVGSAKDLSGITDWTTDRVIAYAEEHPEAELFNHTRKSSVMEFMMLFGQESFWNRETGECRFDSEEFKALLKFVNHFPDTVQDTANFQPEPARIQAGEVLLSMAFETGLNSFQRYKEMFRDGAVYIGYPTVDGSGGHRISNAYQIYGISSESDLQDGAWEFIESVLTQKKSILPSFGFPTLKLELERDVQEALYVLDENGEPLLDEEGNPIPNTGSTSIYWSDGWTYTYRTPTKEEIDIVLDLIGKARLVSEEDDEILSIINEEAEPFFQGQKSVEEVADVIQSKVSLYVSEMM